MRMEKGKREVVSKIISNRVIFDHFTMKNWFSNFFKVNLDGTLTEGRH